MSIASEITRITDNVSDSYTAANAKGATMPATQDSDHLAATIATIPSGITPTGTMYIISNGTYNVEDKAIANVNVPTTAPAHYIEKSVRNGELITGGGFINLTGVTSLPRGSLQYAFCAMNSGAIGLPSTVDDTIPALNNIDIDFSNITYLGNSSLYASFYGRRGINSVTFGSATSNVPATYAFAFSDVKTFTLSATTTTDLGSYICYGCQSLQSFLCPNLESMTLGGFYTVCKNCEYLTTVDLSKLRMLGTSGETSYNYFVAAFEGCKRLQSLNLNKLECIYGYSGTRSNTTGACKQMCDGCTALVTVGLDSLQTIGSTYYSGTNSSNGLCSSMFSYCTSLRIVKFKSLSFVGSYALGYGFQNCTSLEELWFYALTDATKWASTAFSLMLYGCSNVTVHFPKVVENSVSSYSPITAGFNGTNTTVLFDIVTSLTGADTNTYTRQEKDSTATATAWVNNDVLYYTSGTTEPVVGDTIYSDAACTTAVTTISAIA